MVNLVSAHKFELFMGCLGNGITVCNKAVIEDGDYKKVAHISPEGNVTWYVKRGYVPAEDSARIENVASTQKQKYDTWWASLSEAKRYELTLEKMTLSELVAHIKQKRQEREAKKNEDDK